MKQLFKPSENLGGLLKIWLILPEEVSFSIDTLTINSLDNLVELYCSPESMSLAETEEKNFFGSSFNVSIQGTIPKNTHESQLITSQLTRYSWLAILLDQNEQFRLAGTNEIPLHLSLDHQTGKEISELASSIVNIYGKQLAATVFIDTIILGNETIYTKSLTYLSLLNIFTDWMI